MALCLAALALTGFVRRQAALARSGDPGRALMDVRLFSVVSFRNGNIASSIIGLGEFGIVAVLPLWLQFTLGYSALQAGLALVPLAAGSFLASGASFGMTGKLTPVDLVRLGLILEIVGLAGLALIATTDSSWWAIALALLLYGVGVGFATAQVTNVVLADIPSGSAGQGSGIQSAARELGFALGIAVLTTVFFSTLGARLGQILTATGMPAAQADRFAGTVADSAGAAIASLASDPQTAAVADAARVAMTEGITLTGYLAAGLLLLGLIATAFIPATAAAPSPAEPARS